MKKNIVLLVVFLVITNYVYGQNIYQGGQGSGYASAEVLLSPNHVIIQKNIILNAPNILDKNQNLMIVLPEGSGYSGQYEYNLSDLIGRIYKPLVSENTQNNQVSISISTKNLDSGWYYLSLTSQTRSPMFYRHKFFIKP